MATPDGDGDLLSASVARLAVGLTAIGTIAVADGWRPALVVGLAGAAVAATRVRFADWVAVGVLTAWAVLTLAGRGLGA